MRPLAADNRGAIAMRTRNSQRGVSLISVLLLLAILGVGFTIGIRLFPVYMDYYNVKSIMNEVAHSPGIGSKNYHGVWDGISKRLDINDINDITQKNFKMKTVGNQTTLTVKYQVKRHLIANIDGLMSFDYSVSYESKNSGG
jgi:hypothetical protein